MKRLVVILTAFICLAGYAQTRVDSIRTCLLDPTGRPLVAAHRGVWTEVRENSIASIEAAIDAGAEIIELDVRKTRKGELILHHDPVRERPRYATSLEDALLAVKGRAMVNIDKSFIYFADIVKLAERTGTLDHLIFKSEMRAAQAKAIMGSYVDKVIYMPIVRLCNAGALACILEYVQQLDPPVYEMVFPDDSNPAIQIAIALLQGRSRIWVNTMWPSLCGGHDDAASMKDFSAGYGWLMDKMNVSVMQTDQTAFLVQYLKNR